MFSVLFYLWHSLWTLFASRLLKGNHKETIHYFSSQTGIHVWDFPGCFGFFGALLGKAIEPLFKEIKIEALGEHFW